MCLGNEMVHLAIFSFMRWFLFDSYEAQPVDYLNLLTEVAASLLSPKLAKCVISPLVGSGQ